MRTIRLLTIGNSFAENALTYLEAMAESTHDVRFKVGTANLGGCSLAKHWNLAAYTAKHPEYKTYRLFKWPDGTATEANLQEALAAEPWDYVTLQQVSSKSWLRDSYLPHLGLLHGLVRELAPRAAVLLHQTWAYRSDSPFLPQNSLTQKLMFERIRANYTHFGAEWNCRVLPSGEAVQNARDTPGRTFAWPDPDYDYQNAEAPTLPRQEHSLAVGWRWIINGSPEGIPELNVDPNHLNDCGCYLAGCVWFERLTGFDARKLAFTPSAIDADTAEFLRTTAHDACALYP